MTFTTQADRDHEDVPDPALSVQIDHILEKARHRQHLRSGQKRHSGKGTGSMSHRKYKKVIEGWVPGFHVQLLNAPLINIE